MKLASVVAAIVVSIGTIAAAGPPPAIEEAIKQSKAEHKPLVVEFFTDWCKPCHIFEQTTLVDKRVQAAIGTVVFVRYDAEAAPGLAAAARYKVSSYPTFLAVDKEGVARRTTSGIATDEEGVQQFLKIVGEAATATLDEADVRARVAASPNDAATRLAAGAWYAERGQTADALTHYDAVAGNARADAAARAQASAAGDRLRRLAQWKKQLVAEKLAAARKAPATVSSHDLAIATVDSGVSPAEVRDVIGKVLAATSDASRINGLLYVAIAAGAKDEALAAGKRVLATSKEGGVLDTLAECYYVHGDRADALRVEDQAIALDKSDSLAANRARFDKGTGDANEVIQVRAEAQRVWKRLASIDEQASEPEAPDASSSGDGMPADVMAALMGVRKLGETVGKACAAQAGKSEAAYARVKLDAAGKVTASTLFLDPGASPALRACLTKNLAAATLPVTQHLDLPPINISFVAGH